MSGGVCLFETRSDVHNEETRQDSKYNAEGKRGRIHEGGDKKRRGKEIATVLQQRLYWPVPSNCIWYCTYSTTGFDVMVSLLSRL